MAGKRVKRCEEITFIRFNAERIFATGKFAEGKWTAPDQLSKSEAAIIDVIIRRTMRRIDLGYSKTLKMRDKLERGKGKSDAYCRYMTRAREANKIRKER